jgi:hypothetical protein
MIETESLPLEALMDHGILWYINRVAFHPRGLMLALEVDDVSGEVVGFRVIKSDAGTFVFSVQEDDEKFAAFNNLLASLQ